jgi:hypothetical protein
VLLRSLIPLGLPFAISVTLARTYHVREAGFTREWFQRGNDDFSAAKPPAFDQALLLIGKKYEGGNQ